MTNLNRYTLPQRLQKPKKQKIKKPSRKKLVKNADTEFSLYIRLRDHNRCVICGTTENPTCGHLFSRINYNTRWDEEASFCQCTGCNYRHELNAHIFIQWFIHKFGYEKYDELYRKHLVPVKFRDYDLIDIANKFKEKRKSLEGLTF